MDYQRKIREAKLKAAKELKEKEETPLLDLSELNLFLEKLYEEVNGVIVNNNELFKKMSEAQKEHAIALNNQLVTLISAMPKEVVVENISGAKTSSVQVTNLKDLKIKIPETVRVKDLQWLAKDSTIKQLRKELANIANQLDKDPPEPGRAPEDFVPFRRVIKVGKVLMFDDSTWGGGGGGGSVFDTTGLATEAKQDDIIAIMEGRTTPLDSYTYIQKDTTGATYKYYGYADANTAGGWAIKRITISTNLAEYIKGTTDYTTNWTGRAGLTYADIWSTF